MIIKKFDANIIGYINLFKKITRVEAKDCFTTNGMIIFITEPGQAGLAVGKQGRNIQDLKRDLQKDVKIIEHADNPSDLVKNFVFPLEPANVFLSEQDSKKIINVQFSSGRERRFLLGENQAKLKQLKEIIKRYFPEIEEIIVPQ